MKTDETMIRIVGSGDNGTTNTAWATIAIMFKQ